MESDSDSDASHVSVTPPNSPPSAAAVPLPLPRHIALLSTNSTRTKKTSASISTTSRPILQLKISKKHSNPPPKPDQFESEYVNPSPNLSDFSIPIKKPGIPNDPNGPANRLLHGGHCASRFVSFMKLEGKFLKPEPDNSAETKNAISAEISAGSRKAAKDEVDDKMIMSRKTRKTLNLIGAQNSDVPTVKRVVKNASEGNFVKLNINGYGRKKFKYKNNRPSFSSSNKRRKYYSKGSKGSVKGGAEENGIIDEEGLLVDIRKGQDKLNFQDELIEEAVERVKNEVSDDNLLKLLKLTHGYDSFRDGQLEAIKMVLSRKSAMLVLPTGAGKSLCYQLPALVLPGVTLVVSPLVALMIDQLRHLPPTIPGGLLCSSQTAEEALETVQLLQEGSLKVLFVSPERFLNAEFISIFSDPSLLSLVVVDEAHCVSEWSHNFRPSYMRLRASLLRDRLNAGCILAMTATATNRALCDVMQALDIPPTNLIHSTKLRDNLSLSVSVSGNRTKDLLALLKSSPFLDIKSIIVYCKFQSETDMISKYLCDYSISAKSYHSGIPAKDRGRIQDLFCSNKIRVVVATVAFGMGLDKSDVGAVIHYSLPESLEEYVQEIGRAGRDGRLSYCHLLFDDATYFKLHSLMHSDGVDEYAVNKLLYQIFTIERPSTEEIYSIVKESASRKFDMKEEVILTIMTQLELGEVQYIHLLPQMNVTCTLNFHQTLPQTLAAKDIVVAAILKKSEMKDGHYVFNIPSVANSIRMQALNLSTHLLSLKLKGEITYELKDQAICYTVLEVPKDICYLAAQLTKWLGEVETCKPLIRPDSLRSNGLRRSILAQYVHLLLNKNDLDRMFGLTTLKSMFHLIDDMSVHDLFCKPVRKVDAVFNAVTFAAKACDNALGCHKNQHTPCLQRTILEYFNGNGDAVADVPIQMDRNSRFLRADVKVFLQSNSQMKFTPRAVARILHGLSSPAFPSATWSRTHFWGRYVHIDFRAIMEASKQELINFVGKDVT